MSGIFRFLSILVLLSLVLSPAGQALSDPLPVLAQPLSQQGNTFHIAPGQAKKIEYAGAVLDMPAGSVSVDTTVSIATLLKEELPGLDQGMTNATGGPRGGYRMLPHHSRFNQKITITLPYNPALIPPGLTEQDLKTYFYNDQTGTWQELERVSVDTRKKQVVSLSDHFTDFINATLTVPDHPDALAYNPNSISGIKAADPGTGINLIEPPQGSSTGEARLSYPILVPPGRAGMQPQLSVTYSSSAGNGWMGLGWDLQLPQVMIDTRWGVPRYDSANETETYLLNGRQLTPLANRDDLVARSAEKEFHERVEGAFSRIQRHGDSPKNFWWEITDKNGVRSIYGNPTGDSPSGTAILADSAGNIFKWALREMTDLNGNSIYYTYDLVQNNGMAGGTVPGWQLYPKSIDYTRNNGTSGPYTVTFTWDAGRPDVIIDARGGFKMVTAARLTGIQVHYREAQVRAYQFEYEQGAFSKTRLAAISQLGEANELFHTHTFSYYDDIQSEQGFSKAETWATGDNNEYVGWLTGSVLRQDLITSLTSKINEGNASSLSGAVSDSYGFHQYIGYSPIGTKWISAGYKTGNNYSETNTILTLIDINGDSLVDKVFQDKNGISYRLNKSGPGGEPQFDALRTISTIHEIGKEVTNMESSGYEAYLVAGAFTNESKSTTTSSIYFTDANGDGLPDLARNGVIYFNHLDQNGVPTFTRRSGDTPVPLGPGVDAAQVVVTQEDLDNYQKAIDAYPLLDTLRRWTAPYSGTVAITAPVRLLPDQTGEGDGVRVAIQQNERELWSATIQGDDYREKTPSGLESIPVSAGDRIYFRVQSGEDGRLDQVLWEPIIAYSAEAPAVDVNGLDAYRYQASQEFTLAGRPGVSYQVPVTGTVQLSGVLRKLARTTDDIRLTITVDDQPILSREMKWDETGSIPVNQTFEVENHLKEQPAKAQNSEVRIAEEDLPTTIRVTVSIDSPIDLAALQWTPTLQYTAVEGEQDDQLPSAVNLPYDIDIYPATNLTGPQESWIATQDGKLIVKTGFANFDATKGSVVFTVKRAGAASETPPEEPLRTTFNGPETDPPAKPILNPAAKRLLNPAGEPAMAAAAAPAAVPVESQGYGELLAKSTIKAAGAEVTNAELTIEVKKDDVLYFDYSTRDPDLAGTVTAASVEVKYEGSASAISVPSAVHSAVSTGLFGQPYRGWAYAGYNGNRERADKPIDEARLVFVPPDPNDPDDKLADASAFPFGPVTGDTPALDAWGGVDDLAYVTARIISSSRLGNDSITPPGMGGYGGAAPQLISKTLQNSLGVGIGPVNAAYSGHPGMVGLGFLEGLPELGLSYSLRDYMDMNGDNFPDVVGQGKIQFTNMRGGLTPMEEKQYFSGWVRESQSGSANAGIGGNIPSFRAGADGTAGNTGSGSSNGAKSGSQMVSLGISVGGSVSANQVVNDLIDINGDGLPDRIAVNGTHIDKQEVNCGAGANLCVALNLGYGFAPLEPWGQGEISAGAGYGFNISPGLGFNDGIYDYAFGLSLERSWSLAACRNIKLTLEQRNNPDTTGILSKPCNEENIGTLLQDINGDGLVDLVKVRGEDLYVSFNTGSGFYSQEVLWAKGVQQVGQSTNTTLGGGVYVTIPVYIVYGFILYNAGGDYSRSIGRQEAQLRDIDGDGYVDFLTSLDPNSMNVRRSQIGKTNLLKTVERPLGARISLDYQRDGNTTENPHSRWVLSRVETFDGYQGDGADTRATTYTYTGGYYDRLEREFFGYRQVIAHELDTTKTEDTVYRSTVREYAKDSYYRKGLLEREAVQNKDGFIFTETVKQYDLRVIKWDGKGALKASTTATLFPMLVKTVNTYFEEGSAGRKSTYSTLAYDDYGNVTGYYDAGDEGTQDDVSATVTYSNCPESYVMAVPVSMIVTNFAEVTLRERYAAVDCPTGEVTEVRQVLENGSAALTSLAYWPNGNLKQVTGPANLHGQRYQLAYEYDPEVQTHVTRVTDSFGYSSTSTYNEKYGLVESTEDLNGNRLVYTYDAFGRTATIVGPYEQDGESPTLEFAYYPNDPVPWALTRHLDLFRGSDSMDTVLFTDGLKRLLQTKKDGTLYQAPDQPAEDVMLVSGRVYYDFAGRLTDQYYPTTEAPGKPGDFNTGRDPVAPTHTDYDVLDRALKITLPDETFATNQYRLGPDRDGKTQFEMITTDANGVDTVTYKNVLELVVSKKQFNQGGQQVIWTSYTYNPLKQLSGVVDDQGNQTTVTYDTLGRRTVIDSPDAGLTEITYDLASNITSRKTANLRAENQQIVYDYDFSRLKSITYPDYPGNNVTYAYGEPGAPDNRANRVTLVTSQAGSEERFYGKLGEVVKEIKAVNTFVAGHRAVYTTQYLYDTWGRLQQMRYPDGEVLTYRYNAGGLVSQVSGVKGSYQYDYARRIEYDRFEQRAFVEAGNNVRTEYTYRPDNRRLEELKAGQGSPFQDLIFTYDKAGNVTALDNIATLTPAAKIGGLTTSQDFQYDDLYQLVGASGSYWVSPNKTNRYQLTMRYDSIANLLTKQQVNEMVQPSGTVTTLKKTTYDWTYDYAGEAAGPHAATRIGDRAYTYDANGNQLGWTNLQNGTRRVIAWDEENRIQNISDNGQTQEYRYDDAGQRVIKRGPQGETVTVNQFYTVRNGALGTKHIFAGSMRLVSKLVKDGPLEKDQYYYHPDHLGSSSYVTNADGQVYEHMEYFPFGETWVQEASNTERTPYLFTGKELDEETGLYYFGARYYDPRTSLWQSPDPAVESYLADPSSGEVFLPANLSLYAYVQQNPLKHTDPDGRRLRAAEGSSQEFINKVTMALNYLARSKTADKVLRDLIKSKEIITIKETSGVDDKYKPGEKTIYWDPKFSPTWKSGAHLSPAMALLHEGGHALKHLTSPKDYEKFHSHEEARNLWQVEWPAAKELGEPIRSNYFDTAEKQNFFVNNPTAHTINSPIPQTQKLTKPNIYVPGLDFEGSYQYVYNEKYGAKP